MIGDPMKPSPQSFLRYPLDAIFGKRAYLRVMRTLSNHGGEMSSTDVATYAVLSKPSVLAALDHLANIGIIEALGSGRARVYRIDTKHPLSLPISAIFAAERERFTSILDAVRAAVATTDVAASWLYGSVARGEDRTDSDFDVVLVNRQKSATVKPAVREALDNLEDSLRFSVSIIDLDADDVTRLHTIQDPWWMTMSAQAVPLTGPDPASFVSKLMAAKGAQK
jgi:predicted nucleotidyltransferase